MNIRTFWNILLKIIGIFLVVNGVTLIMEYLGYFTVVSGLEYTISMLGLLILYFFVLWLFVFKTSWLIDKLDLEKGFEEERIDLKNDFSAIMNIAIIVIGCVIFLDTLPLLCKSIFTYYQQKSILFFESPTASWIILYGIKTLAGFFLWQTAGKLRLLLIRKERKGRKIVKSKGDVKIIP